MKRLIAILTALVMALTATAAAYAESAPPAPGVGNQVKAESKEKTEGVRGKKLDRAKTEELRAEIKKLRDLRHEAKVLHRDLGAILKELREKLAKLREGKKDEVKAVLPLLKSLRNEVAQARQSKRLADEGGKAFGEAKKNKDLNRAIEVIKGLQERVQIKIAALKKAIEMAKGISERIK